MKRTNQFRIGKEILSICAWEMDEGKEKEKRGREKTSEVEVMCYSWTVAVSSLDLLLKMAFIRSLSLFLLAENIYHVRSSID